MEQTLGKRIASNRKRMKLTQDQLAEKLGVTAQAVSKWENDQSCPDITTLPQLAEIFGITTDTLLGRETPPTFQGEVVKNSEPEGVHIQKGDWTFRYDSGRRDAVAFALLVLLVGVLTLTSRLLSWDVSFWSILWPSALLIFGFKGLLPRFSVFSLGVMLLGGYFLVNNLGILSLNITGELVFPILILLFGLSLLIDALRKPKKPSISFSHCNDKSNKAHSTFFEENEHFECSVSFCENTHIVTLPRLSSGDASVSFGELTLDLSQCEEIADDCELDVRCSFGELVLVVPKTCRVIPDSSTSFGSLEFSGHPNADAQAVIRLDGSVSFGSIEIRYL